MDYYLAIDIGASSGRHILGYLVDDQLMIEEVYRFKNQMGMHNDRLTWDIRYLFEEVIHGLIKCKEIGKIPSSLGIDTWGVDFALIDNEGKLIDDVVAYRDSRTVGMDHLLNQIISDEMLYKKTGIQKQLFNTIYQLLALKMSGDIKYASKFLLVPDYLHFLLTGKDFAEYTNASTTGMVDVHLRDWDYDLIQKLGFDDTLFPKIITPGTSLGNVLPEIAEIIGYSCKVILPATHDTASAVVAIPIESENEMYISSGTWSLVGAELKEPIVTEMSQKKNFTNEGGYGNAIRFLKNVMGLWMIQCIKNEIGGNRTFDELTALAMASKVTSVVECNDQRFFSPVSMVDEIQRYCQETKQVVPETLGDYAAVVYRSLAVAYLNALKDLEMTTGKVFSKIHIVGGGALAEYLNQMTATVTHIDVESGPVEATALGNLIVQMIADQKISSLKDARQMIKKGYTIKHYRGQ